MDTVYNWPLQSYYSMLVTCIPVRKCKADFSNSNRRLQAHVKVRALRPGRGEMVRTLCFIHTSYHTDMWYFVITTHRPTVKATGQAPQNQFHRRKACQGERYQMKITSKGKGIKEANISSLDWVLEPIRKPGYATGKWKTYKMKWKSKKNLVHDERRTWQSFHAWEKFLWTLTVSSRTRIDVLIFETPLHTRITLQHCTCINCC